jgi:hypothetical protein
MSEAGKPRENACLTKRHDHSQGMKFPGIEVMRLKLEQLLPLLSKSQGLSGVK